MSGWLRVLEAYLVQALLRTPAFHRGVEKVARQVHRVRHGIPPEELGGTRIDAPTNGSFLKHFTEEVQTQLGRAEARSAGELEGKVDKSGYFGKRTAGSESEVAVKTEARVEDETSDVAWRSSQQRSLEEGQGRKQGFLGEYVGALREQLKSGK